LSIEVLATPPPNQNYQPPISRLDLDSLDELGVFVPGPPAFTIDDGLWTVAELHRFGVTPVLGNAGTDIVGVGAHALWRRENAEDRFGVVGGELATGSEESTCQSTGRRCGDGATKWRPVERKNSQWKSISRTFDGPANTPRSRS
jgi:hypothetical protein